VRWRRPTRASGGEDGARRIVPFPRSRKVIVDAGRAAKDRHAIRGLIEVDVTEARRVMQSLHPVPSFTAFVVAGVARAVAEHPEVHALRDLRNRLVVYEDVDVNVSVEVRIEDRSFPMNHVLRAADKRSVADLSAELQRIKQQPEDSPTAQLIGAARWFLLLPGFVRTATVRLMYRIPSMQRDPGGTVGVTAIGMFGRGGGWGLNFQVHPLEVVVGGLVEKPGVFDGVVAIREYLDITVGFDHDVVDGAPAARFTARLRDLLASASLFE